MIKQEDTNRDYASESEDPRIYRREPDPHYSDKGGHKESSIANDTRPGGHKKHWRNKIKEEKIERIKQR